MFDITTQAAADTAAIHLKGLDGEHLYDKDGNPVCIVVYGPGSKQFAAVEARQSARAIKRMNDNEGKVSVAPPEQRQTEVAEDLADITVAFQNFDYPAAKGASGQEKFKAFYLDQKLGHLTKQVLKGCNDWGNFKAVSATA